MACLRDDDAPTAALTLCIEAAYKTLKLTSDASSEDIYAVLALFVESTTHCVTWTNDADTAAHNTHMMVKFAQEYLTVFSSVNATTASRQAALNSLNVLLDELDPLKTLPLLASAEKCDICHSGAFLHIKTMQTASADEALRIVYTCKNTQVHANFRTWTK